MKFRTRHPFTTLSLCASISWENLHQILSPASGRVPRPCSLCSTYTWHGVFEGSKQKNSNCQTVKLNALRLEPFKFLDYIHRSHSCFNDLESLAFSVKGPRVLFLQGANNGQWIHCNESAQNWASVSEVPHWHQPGLVQAESPSRCSYAFCAQMHRVLSKYHFESQFSQIIVKFFYILSVRSPVGWLTWILEHALLVLGCWTWWSIATTKDLSSMTCTGRISP